MHTVSFTILDDLEHPKDGPYEVEIENLTFEEIYNAVKKLKYLDINSYLFDYDIYYTGSKYIAQKLLDDGYFVRNRVEKYYVFAFAIDYARFYVFSKDYDKELIDWGEGKEGPIYKNISDEDEDYNINPVIKLLSEINN